MRIDLKKMIFVGSSSKKNDFLSSVQDIGCVQFLGTKISMPDLLATDFREVVQAIKILQHYEAEATPEVQIPDPISFAQKVVADKIRLDQRHIKLKAIKEKLDHISPFGQIPLDQINAIEAMTSMRFQLWVAPAKKNVGALSQDLIEIAEVENNQYFVSIASHPITVPYLEEVPLSEELVNLSSSLHALEAGISELEHSLKGRAGLVESLRESLLDTVNETKRNHVSEKTRKALDDHLFAITAWVPENKLQIVKDVARTHDVYADEIHIGKNEIPPTCLENEKLSQIGEDLVHVYDTPSHTDNDPSLWVLLFFALFFAMIVADGGYGLIFLISAIYFRRKASTESSKRVVKLIALLGSFCIIWGVLTNSFFSLKLSTDNPVRNYSLLTYLTERQGAYHMQHQDHTYQNWVYLHGSAPTSVNEFLYTKPNATTNPLYDDFANQVTLELALLIGCIHIILSICRYLPRNIGNAGWILFIIGGYLYCSNYLHATSVVHYLFGIDPVIGASIGLQLLITGTAFSIVVSTIKNGVTGLFECMTGIQVFADILSYLRIYALGLAGSIMSSMINTLSDKFPFIIAVILIIFAHAVNIVLSVVGGVIHGLRLNYLEWYHYSFEGGGKKFAPLNHETHV